MNPVLHKVKVSCHMCVCCSGEEWLVSKVGAYLPGAHEEVIDIVNAFILTDKVTDSISASQQSGSSGHFYI